MSDEKKDEQDKKKKLKQGESEDITKKATEEEKDFKTSVIEGTKDSSPLVQTGFKPVSTDVDNKSEIQNPKLVLDLDRGSEIVRGEDVVKILRAKGVQI